MFKKRREGFTLVELLIVMAVIAALMGALVPVALSAIRHANATRVAENLQSLVTQVQQYAYSEHTLPSMSALATSVSGGNTTDYVIYGGTSPSAITHAITSGSSSITAPLTYFAVVYTGGSVSAADVYNVWKGATSTISGITGTVMATGVINKYW
ncbi:type II secretion system protein [Athalassotoga saccharophila]|uniref:type II secretion system protein n=1 Tax=Athalassotoga saccharophila TaxID=1441386 RepID=UPI00137A3B3A|nr:type II secretion system protein [Athalassotoga saccharophila]BBJ28264.1 hypothetical protein ATHSA_1167 [Athalassotoga saccharophila]